MSLNDHGLGRYGPGAELKRALTVASKVVDDLFTTAMAELGLSVGEADVLTVLSLDDDPVAPSDMAGWLRLTTAGMAGRLNTLDRKGLIERKPHPSDGRRLEVYLTAAGKELARRVLATKDEVLQTQVVERLGGDAIRQLIDGLDALILTADTPL